MLLIIKYSVKAYDEFDNRYHYDSIGGNTTYNRSVSTQDEVLFILDFSASMNKKWATPLKHILQLMQSTLFYQIPNNTQKSG